MTQYETTARPIRTIEELAEAETAHARLEFSACMAGALALGALALGPNAPDTYEDASGAEGWVSVTYAEAYPRVASGLLNSPGCGLRAFYPIGGQAEAPDDATIGADPEMGYAELSSGPAQPPYFRVVVTIEADSQEGYAAALVTLANGWNGWDA